MNGKDYDSLISTPNRFARKYVKSADRLLRERPDWLKSLAGGYTAIKVKGAYDEETARRTKSYKEMMKYINKWSPDRKDGLTLPSELDYVRGDKKADYKGFEFSTDTLDILARKESAPPEILEVLGMIEKDYPNKDEGGK